MAGLGFLLLAELSRPAKPFPGQAKRRFLAEAALKRKRRPGGEAERRLAYLVGYWVFDAAPDAGLASAAVGSGGGLSVTERR